MSDEDLRKATLIISIKHLVDVLQKLSRTCETTVDAHRKVAEWLDVRHENPLSLEHTAGKMSELDVYLARSYKNDATDTEPL